MCGPMTVHRSATISASEALKYGCIFRIQRHHMQLGTFGVIAWSKEFWLGRGCGAGR